MWSREIISCLVVGLNKYTGRYKFQYIMDYALSLFLPVLNY